MVTTDSLPEDRAREILRRIRDLNLTAARVTIAAGLRVSVDGCATLDEPVEHALAYHLRVCGGPEHLLQIAWERGALELTLSDRSGAPIAEGRRVELLSDGRGRATAPRILARIDPSRAGRREVEHFLRRLVRGAYAA